MFSLSATSASPELLPNRKLMFQCFFGFCLVLFVRTAVHHLGREWRVLLGVEHRPVCPEHPSDLLQAQQLRLVCPAAEHVSVFVSARGTSSHQVIFAGLLIFWLALRVTPIAGQSARFRTADVLLCMSGWNDGFVYCVALGFIGHPAHCHGRYGFHRSTEPKGRVAPGTQMVEHFTHQYFQRGKEHLLSNIHRKTSKLGGFEP
jgi:hypothetical protein